MSEEPEEVDIQISKLSPAKDPSLISKLFVRESESEEQDRRSALKTVPGLVAYPWNILGIYKLRDLNATHSACIDAKVSCTVGLGVLSEEERTQGVQTMGSDSTAFRKAMELAGIEMFKNEQSKVEQELGPLTDAGFFDVLYAVAEDLEETGTAYMEVVREDPNDQDSNILGLYHIMTSDCHAVAEDDGCVHFFLGTNYNNIHVPKFGDVERFMDKYEHGEIGGVPVSGYPGGDVPHEDRNYTHGRCEVIRFKRPTNSSRYYGKASWLAATANIEMSNIMRSARFDVFNDRGLPDSLLTVLGKKINKDDWAELVEIMSPNVGAQNNHRSAAVNIPLKDVTLQIDNFDPPKDMYSTITEERAAEAQAILTAHRTPAIIANIQIPGKMAASNEFLSNLQMFQALVISQEQLTIQSTIWDTLCNEELNGDIDLVREDFILKKITDLVDLANANVVAQMREELPAANAEGRDTSKGLKN